MHVLMSVSTFKTDVILLIGNVMMCLTSHWLMIFSIRVSLLILTIWLREIKGKVYKLPIISYTIVRSYLDRFSSNFMRLLGMLTDWGSIYILMWFIFFLFDIYGTLDGILIAIFEKKLKKWETEDRKQDDSNIGPLEKRISRAVGFVFIILFWKIIFC
jgi:hypothetical protein